MGFNLYSISFDLPRVVSSNPTENPFVLQASKEPILKKWRLLEMTAFKYNLSEHWLLLGGRDRAS